ncbi:transcription factor atf-2 isoform X1 [Labrus bergylta]|uniref:transcription factor atf-2 isoform X1 n=1 Tax=Labrus bergylta TaxID=56723 RepID=UPI0010FB1DF5|nr:uncharacterized protein LOC109982799 isoform X2 [Labrus bergylta]
MKSTSSKVDLVYQILPKMSTSRSPDRPGHGPPCLPSSTVDSSGLTEHDPDPDLLFPFTRRLLRFGVCSSPVTRRKREMIPADKKDTTYWDKRQKNNEAAKRSREKKRLNDLVLEGQLLALKDENAQLRAEVLSMQYYSSLNAEESNHHAARATSDSTVPLHPKPSFVPALLQRGLWDNSRSNQVSVMGVRQQEAAMNPFDAKIPCLSYNTQVFQTCGAQQGIPPFSGPCFPSPTAHLEVGRSAETESDPQRQVSSSDDFPRPTYQASSIQASLGSFPLASNLPNPSQTWLVPCVNHPALRNNVLLHWPSSYLPPPAVLPGLPPLYIQARRGHGLGVEDDLRRGFKSGFGRAEEKSESARDAPQS